jgi:hypothetical protein
LNQLTSLFVEGIGWKTRIEIMMKNYSVNQPTLGQQFAPLLPGRRGGKEDGPELIADFREGKRSARKIEEAEPWG